MYTNYDINSWNNASKSQNNNNNLQNSNQNYNNGSNFNNVSSSHNITTPLDMVLTPAVTKNSPSVNNFTTVDLFKMLLIFALRNKISSLVNKNSPNNELDTKITNVENNLSKNSVPTTGNITPISFLSPAPIVKTQAEIKAGIKENELAIANNKLDATWNKYRNLKDDYDPSENNYSLGIKCKKALNEWKEEKTKVEKLEKEFAAMKK